MSEEKISQSISNLRHRVDDLKNYIALSIEKFSLQPCNWNQIIETSSRISSLSSGIKRLIENDQSLLIKNLVPLPIAVNPEPDPEIEILTNRRFSHFNHQTVPNLFYTKSSDKVEKFIDEYLDEQVTDSDGKSLDSYFDSLADTDLLEYFADLNNTIQSALIRASQEIPKTHLILKSNSTSSDQELNPSQIQEFFKTVYLGIGS